jgi:hypothetical protein
VYIHDEYGKDLTVITTFEITFPNGFCLWGIGSYARARKAGRATVRSYEQAYHCESSISDQFIRHFTEIQVGSESFSL